MMTSDMQPNTICPSAEIVSNPGWTLPPYSTTPVHPKNPPPPYSSLGNQQDHSPHQNQSLGSMCAPLYDQHYPVQPHTDEDVPGRTIIFVPEPVENSKSRTVGTFVAMMLVFCVFSYIIRILWFLT